jgi:CRISPR system Cascade subunit CasA
MPFNLIEERWIPVLTRNGRRRLITPYEITEDFNGDYVAVLNAPRPDFNGALIQFLIGLTQTCFPLKGHEAELEWEDLLERPPSTGELREAFSKHAHAFNLDGDGPRFMQDLELRAGEAIPVSSLMIEAPTGKTHFVKDQGLTGMCHACVATALFTLQTNAPSGGRGHRTSLRGGGPLTTLVISEREVLWETVWLNVLTERSFKRCIGSDPNRQADSDRFPWLAATRCSDDKSGAITTPQDTHPGQVFWAMPRRIHLDFSHTGFGVCPVCGAKSELLVRQYITKNHGVNYQGPWRHPLSPHNVDAQGNPLALHAQPGGITYRHWLGLVQEAAGTSGKKAPKIEKQPAYVVHAFRNGRQKQMKLRYLVWAFGYDMDKMKARCWYDSQMPLHYISENNRNKYEGEAAALVMSAQQVAGNLRGALNRAWFPEGKKTRGDFGFVDAAFWHDTEAAFYSALSNIKEFLETNQDTTEIRNGWHKVLCDQSERIFDRYALSGPIEDADPKRIAIARTNLRRFNRGKNIRVDLLNLPSSKTKQ